MPRGIGLPPSSWTLAILLLVYSLTGLVGHDPWKSDDAVTIGVVHDLLTRGDWLTPGLAGRPYPDAPVYYWVAAGFAKLASAVLPVHQSARLASGLFTLLALAFILFAARELHGPDQSSAAPLLLAGSVGFIYHAHEAQPMLATLTAYTAAYWALTQFNRRPVLGALSFGSALGFGCLANGLTPVLPLIPVAGFVAWRSERRLYSTLLMLASLLLAAAIVASWLVPVYATSPTFFAAIVAQESEQIAGTAQPLLSLLRFLFMLPWYAWPALPLACWTLWAKRRQLGSQALSMPLAALLITLLLASLWLGPRSVPALLLLPPLVLLAVPAVPTLRRGAANAFDWFGMITFSFFALLVWVGWSAMVFDWPPRLARQVVRLAPGFVGHFSLLPVLVTVAATLAWSWLIATSPRSPMRGVLHWMAGLTLLWLLVTSLWMPWIDYGKSYRQVSLSLAAALPEKRRCIASVSVGDPVLASLDYFSGIRTIPSTMTASASCDLLLIHGAPRYSGVAANIGWRKIWEGGRPAERAEGDRLHLFQRDAPQTGQPGR
ncbi:glycosyltransferase family 39 protein [Accumulibacter sp.]|uniref:ArnT family glycosyltransferase n=1 Tax=Accumulibacter sp. TaxID=2053492 RepID=UPI0025DE90B2|nr:glycosyltransferase family 39 protein [Accumulibacter sp.]MCM8594531.1 glycosyltransferase family 39 protein [Accumulibacter sp.]MCM8627379.1 glycosyltransferase family 39 protein [Accumulibacter sp.]MDS4048677.1 glycosyltransferase family 39 protein [Accumulibacter sp.]